MNGSADPVGRYGFLVAALAAERIYSTVVGAIPGAAVGHLDTRRQVR